MIDQAEQFLRSLGFHEIRVRYHRGDLARIEVGTEDLGKVTKPDVMKGIDQRCRELGFQFVTIDLGGFRSGSLNSAIVPLARLGKKT